MGWQVQKFVKIALVVCLAIAAVPVALFGWLGLWSLYKTAQVESFIKRIAC